MASDSNASHDEKFLSGLKVSELKTELDKRGKDNKGNKATLMARLREVSMKKTPKDCVITGRCLKNKSILSCHAKLFVYSCAYFVPAGTGRRRTRS